MKKKIAIIGGGTSALVLSLLLDSNKYEVHIYEKNKTIGRKFLVAGDGGFNLTHASNIQEMIKCYSPNSFLKQSLLHFTNEDFRLLLLSIGIPTYEGTSKRVFPEKGYKPIQVLNAFLYALQNKGVLLNTEMEWKGWKNGRLIFGAEEIVVGADFVVFALGGASWPVTGSTGTWTAYFSQMKITTMPFSASNCGFTTSWSADFKQLWQGAALKNIALYTNHSSQKGEIVITSKGIEGNAVYALSGEIQNQLKEKGCASINLDMKPSFSLEKVTNILIHSKQKNTSNALRHDLKIPEVLISLLKECLCKEDFLDYSKLAHSIKGLKISILESSPLEEAISSIGGVSLNVVDKNFEIRTLPNHFCIGEMLDWDAPTGGYLIQGCASMGALLAKYFNELK